MADAYAGISTKSTPQNVKAKAGQVKNAAGGYVFKIDDKARARRFLTLGSTGGTYYSGEKELTRENAEVIVNLAQSDEAPWLVETIVEISQAGRAPKQNPAIFALAICASLGNDEVRKAALDAVKLVCRTLSTLMLFVKYTQQFRGWGAGLRRAVSAFFTDKPIEDVAYQAIKYRQREGWTNRDLLRSAHPKIDIPSGKALFNWVATGDVKASRGPGGDERPVGASRADLPAIIEAFEEAQSATTVADWTRLIETAPLSWEMLPDIALKERAVWEALIQNKRLPIGALIRQLPRLTNAGVWDNGDLLKQVVADLQDVEKLRKGRIHPINQLVAMKTYAGGHSLRGSSTWTPNRKLVDALDASFYAAYGAVEPAGKRFLLALDISGSMTWAPCSGSLLTPREVSAALSLVTMNVEQDCDIIGFTHGGYGSGSTHRWAGSGVSELTLSSRQRLDDALRYINGLQAGGTDIALPFRWAKDAGKDYDTVVIMTDNETWSGDQHPFQSLREYRDKVGHEVRQVVVAMTATDVSVADPTDALSLDIAGFDSAAPNLISSFARGDV